MGENEKRILIIEDDQAIAELERDYLCLSGFTVDIVQDGRSGLEAAERDYQLIILDLMLPEIDGFEVLKRIRETKNTPVLIISARKDDIDKIRGLGLGADDYMTKPFSASEMVARVKAHMNRYERLVSEKKEQNVIEIRGLRMDRSTHEAVLNGRPLTLTTKEYDLLYFLLAHPNRVFSKDELFREIWKMDSVGEVATVTVHIKRLREKIEADITSPQYIETIWGVGYRFKV